MFFLLKFTNKVALVAMLFFICNLSQAAGTTHLASKANIDIPRTQGTIKIDANLADPQWQKAKRVSMNIVTRPYDNTPSPVSTQAMLMENGDTLYIAFIAQDPAPSEIRAFLKDRDRSTASAF